MGTVACLGRFHLGRVLATQAAMRALMVAEKDPMELLSRHQRGDWGDLGDDDKESNELALIHGARLLSAYNVAPDLRLWIITEADRSATTILLPEDY